MSQIWSEKYNTYIYDSNYMKENAYRCFCRKPDQPKDENMNPIRMFVNEYLYTPESFDERLSGNELFPVYIKFCEENNFKSINKSNFIKLLKILIIREGYLSNVRYSSGYVKTVSSAGNPMRAPVTYFYNIAFSKEV